MEPYDSVVIIGNHTYKELLYKLSSSKVTVMIEDEVNVETVLSRVKKYKTYSSERTLWIITTGIYSVCEVGVNPDCHQKCEKPITYIYVNQSKTSQEAVSSEVQDILFHINVLCTAVTEELGDNSTVIICPPIPAVIIQEAAFEGHTALHKMCERFYTSCASDSMLFKLHIIFNILCEAWTSLASDWLRFAKQTIFTDFQESYRGKNLVAAKSERIDYDYVEKGWLIMMNLLLSEAIGIQGLKKKEEEEVVGSIIKTEEKLPVSDRREKGMMETLLALTGEADEEPGYETSAANSDEISKPEMCGVISSPLEKTKKPKKSSSKDRESSKTKVKKKVKDKVKDKVKVEPAEIIKSSVTDDIKFPTQPKDKIDEAVQNFTMSLIKEELIESTSIVKKEPKDGVDIPKFEHCVIIGTYGYFAELKLMLRNLPVSFLEQPMDLDDDGLSVIKREQKNFPKKTMWIIVRGVSEITEISEDSPKCMSSRVCDDFLYVFVLKNSKTGDPDFKDLTNNEMVAQIIKNAFKFAQNTSEFLDESSCLFLAPIIPVFAYYGDASSPLSHAKLHECADKDPRTPILAGSAKDWLSCVRELDEKWMHMVMETLNESTDLYKILKKYIDSKIQRLAFNSKQGDNDGRINRYLNVWGTTVKNLICCFLGKPVEGLKHSPLKISTVKDPDKVPNIKTEGPEEMPHFTSFPPPPLPLSSVVPYPQISMAQQIAPPAVVNVLPVVDVLPAENPPDQSYLLELENVKKEVENLHALQEAKREQNRADYVKKVKGDEENKVHIYIKNVNKDIKQDHIKQILEACGSVMSLSFPIVSETANKIIVTAQFNNHKATARCVRILNFLKVFGKDSIALAHDGASNKYFAAPKFPNETHKVRELQSEDRLIIPLIQDVIKEMAKAKKQSNQPVVSIVAKKQTLPPPLVVTSAAPKEEPIPEPAPQKIDINKPIMLVRVSNLSKYVALNMIKEIIRVCGSLQESDVKKGEFTCILQEKSVISRLLKVMNNFRLPDVKLKVVTEEKLDVGSLFLGKETEELRLKVNMLYKSRTEAIAATIRDSFNKDINYFTYKTMLCRRIRCADQKSCVFYHTVKDKRRTPTSIYSAAYCATSNQNPGNCKMRDECPLCHTTTEKNFHIDNFRKTLCVPAMKRGVCDAPHKPHKICNFAHPESPDMFFHEDWEDLYVEGFGETFNFINGAIKNSFKLKNEDNDMLILILTPTFDMVQLIEKTFSPIAKACKQNMVFVTQYGSIPSDGTIAVSTPASLIKVLKRRDPSYDFERVKAIIFDDGLKLFSDLMNMKDRRITRVLTSRDVNKVIIDDKVNEGTVQIAANVLKCELKMLLAERPKKKWEPQNKDLLTKYNLAPPPAPPQEQEPSKAAPPVAADGVFKVPTLPPPKLKTKFNLSADGKKDSTADDGDAKNDSMSPSSRQSQLDPNDNKTENEPKVDALKQLMADYKDFQKGGNTASAAIITTAKKEEVKKGNITMHAKRWDDYEKRPPPKIPANKTLPYYSANEVLKEYATIPFSYDGKSSGQDDGTDVIILSQSEESDKSSSASSKSKNAKRSRWDNKPPPPKSISEQLATAFTAPKDLSSASRDSRSQKDLPSTESKKSGKDLDSQSQKSRSSKDYNSMSSDSRRSSKDYDSPSRDSKRSSSKNYDSPSSDSKRSSSSRSSKSRDSNKKSYSEAEKELKDEHTKATQLFIDHPEMHPKYESKYQAFHERYLKQFPKNIDPQHKEQKWFDFWKMVVGGLQEIEFGENLDNLKKQYSKDEESGKKETSNKSKTDDQSKDDKTSRSSSKRNDRSPEKKGGSPSNKRSSSKSSSSSDKSKHGRSKSPERSKHGKSKSPDRRTTRKRSRSPHSKKGRSRSPNRRRSRSPPRFQRSRSPRLPADFTVPDALNALEEVQNLLGVLSPALAIVIDRVRTAGVNSKESVYILTESDNALLLEMCTKRLNNLGGTSKNENFKTRKVGYARRMAEKLQEYAAFRLKEFVSHKDSRGAESNSPWEPASKKVKGIDVSKIARATHQKGTEATIDFIKNALAYEGKTNPSTEDVNEIYTEVAKEHFQMTLSGFSDDQSSEFSDDQPFKDAFKQDFQKQPSQSEESSDLSSLQGYRGTLQFPRQGRGFQSSQYGNREDPGPSHQQDASSYRDRNQYNPPAQKDQRPPFSSDTRNPIDNLTLNFMNEKLDDLLKDTKLLSGLADAQKTKTEEYGGNNSNRFSMNDFNKGGDGQHGQDGFGNRQFDGYMDPRNRNQYGHDNRNDISDNRNQQYYGNNNQNYGMYGAGAGDQNKEGFENQNQLHGNNFNQNDQNRFESRNRDWGNRQEFDSWNMTREDPMNRPSNEQAFGNTQSNWNMPRESQMNRPDEQQALNNNPNNWNMQRLNEQQQQQQQAFNNPQIWNMQREPPPINRLNDQQQQEAFTNPSPNWNMQREPPTSKPNEKEEIFDNTNPNPNQKGNFDVDEFLSRFR